MLRGKFIATNDCIKKKENRDFPGDSAVKNPIFNAGDEGLIPGQGNTIIYANNEAHASQLQTGRSEDQRRHHVQRGCVR